MKKITAEEFDRKFDDGEDVSEYFDFSKSFRPNQEMKRANVDLPVWMISGLGREAKRLGVTRQALIKFWLGAKLDALAAQAHSNVAVDKESPATNTSKEAA